MFSTRTFLLWFTSFLVLLVLSLWTELAHVLTTQSFAYNSKWCLEEATADVAVQAAAAAAAAAEAATSAATERCMRRNGAADPESFALPFSPRPSAEELAASEEKVDLASEQFPGVLSSQAALDDFDVLVVGAGLSGTVLADLYARKHDLKVLVLERRPHIGGNCYDFAERRTGVRVNLYGAHLFHTGKEEAWRYMNRFSRWTPYEHRVIGRVDGKLVPIPVNIDTVNALLGEDLRSTGEMAAWLARERAHSGVEQGAGAAPESQGREEASPRTTSAASTSASAASTASARTSADVGVERVGKRLYDKLFREYTKKQWGVYPEALGPEVLSRIPVRADWDDRYFPGDAHQALPAEGYTRWFEEALGHPNIRVFTGVDYLEALDALPAFRAAAGRFRRTFFTGQIDQFFRHKGAALEPLQYRTIRFETTVRDEPGVAQPAFVVNEPQFAGGAFTRTAEYKHLHHQASLSARSVLVREFSADCVNGSEPYYPVPSPANQARFERYRQLAVQQEARNNVFFVGRLANYKYFNMDDAVLNALQLYRKLEGAAGEALLEEALAEGAARTPESDHMDVHYIVSIPAKRRAKPLLWLGKLCSVATLRTAEAPSLVEDPPLSPGPGGKPSSSARKPSFAARKPSFAARKPSFAARKPSAAGKPPHGNANKGDVEGAEAESGRVIPVRRKLFLYNMDRSLDRKLVKMVASYKSCVDLRLGTDLFVLNVAPGPAVQSWLQHMEQNSFRFGDANVFVDAGLAPPKLDTEVRPALRLQATKLFLAERSRASQARVFNADIRRVPSALSAEALRSRSPRRTVERIEAGDDDGEGESKGAGNLFHVLPLTADDRPPRPVSKSALAGVGVGLGLGPGLELGKGPDGAGVGRLAAEAAEAADYAQAELALALEPASALRGEARGGDKEQCAALNSGAFVASDAAIRRMLAVHRTALHDVFVPALRDAKHGFQRALEQKWLCLFFDLM